MKFRLLRFLSSAAVLAGIAWSVPAGTAQEAAKPPVPSGNITFSLWGIATQPWQIMIDDFQKTYPNLKVKWTK
jgi:ABC-type glycerol-3-phosphate transport system substrate-binding protein